MSNQPTYEELLARVAQLEAQRKPGMAPSLSMRVGEKGGISIYGTGRFPVTQYAESLLKIITFATGLSVADLKETPVGVYIMQNQATLKFKRGIPEFGIEASAVAPE